MRKRTVTTIETHQIVTVRRPVGATLALCPVCLKEIEMITPEVAAALARVTVRSIYAGVEAGGVHFLETPDGRLLLCADSLFQRNPPSKSP